MVSKLKNNVEAVLYVGSPSYQNVRRRKVVRAFEIVLQNDTDPLHATRIRLENPVGGVQHLKLVKPI